MIGGLDTGQQPERTQLAWRRTVLSVIAGTVIAARYMGGAGNYALALVLPTLAIASAPLLLYACSVRYRHLNECLRADYDVVKANKTVMPGGTLLFALACMSMLISLASGSFIVCAALQ
ncbi:DUF202 domain-containing protein [Georgenia subflava]|uniref:DUF202 domain-containing protein n=1 Tax=Georgenia subflava TaxID=1622177 RepID=UPI00128DFC98|nr:DUF202 domain-containing protein [Georgenia subflava]